MLYKASDIKLKKAASHGRRHKTFHFIWGDQAYTLISWAYDGIHLSILDFTRQIAIPTIVTKVMTTI